MRTYSRRRPDYQVIEDAQYLCRLCLRKPEESVAIFGEDSDNLYGLVIRHAEIVREDKLSNVICIECYKEISKYYEFRKKCELSYQKLKHHLLAIQVKCGPKPVKFAEQAVENKFMDELQVINYKEILPDTTGTNLNDAHINKPNRMSPIDPLTLDVVKTEEIATECTAELPQEITAQVHTEEARLDLPTFLTSILVQLGVIEKENNNITVIDENVNTVELIMGGDDPLVLELMEEDEGGNEENESRTWVVDESQTANINPESTEEGQTAAANSTKAKNHVQERDLLQNGRDLAGPGAEAEAGGRAWCSLCGKWLGSGAALRRHRLVHTGERPHQCPECGKAFTQQASLARHRLLHLERRPFECEQCPKSFTQRSALASHQSAHAPPGCRPLLLHRCRRCPKVFLYHSSLSRHMRVHAGCTFTCGLCRRAFNDKSSLLRHMRRASHRLLPDKSPDANQPSPR